MRCCTLAIILQAAAPPTSQPATRFFPVPNTALTLALPIGTRSSTCRSLPSIAALTSSMRL
jgi:hypothetical protein